MTIVLPPISVIRREASMDFGTQVLPGGVRFRLWAPLCKQVWVRVLDLGQVAMAAQGDGWFEADVSGAAPGMRYAFVLDDGMTVPDPAARYLPQDIGGGVTEIIDPLEWPWSDRGWQGRRWEDLIFYELHVGTFTSQGSYRAAIGKLEHLADLGITAIQLMPLADFPGRWGWGYDGVYLFAPDSSYGRPEDLKAFIDAAHGHGIAVFLDVVFNHFGPEGNILGRYMPVTTSAIETPWGAAIDYGNETVRAFMLANARYWIDEFHLDGLRIDASHEMHDTGTPHILAEMAAEIRAAARGRNVHLVLENSLNQVGWLRRSGSGKPEYYDGQWSDDVHHAIHSVITGEQASYYADYARQLHLVGRALAEGVSWQGEFLLHERRHKGEPSAFLPATAFIGFVQNHDQVGNRPLGERAHQLMPDAALRLWTAILLLSPQLPMLLMGEEWHATTPFLFFSDLSPDLGELIRKSRLAEADKYPGTDPDSVPDPMAEHSFVRSKLDWDERDYAPHATWLELYRQLIALRRAEIIPRLHGMAGHSGRYAVEGKTLLRVDWTLGDGSALTLVANFGPDAIAVRGNSPSQWLWQTGIGSDGQMAGWGVGFALTVSRP